MMGSFFLKEKKGVFWRGLKGSGIFALGFYTHDALTHTPKRVAKKAKQALAEVKSVTKVCRGELAKLKKINKEVDDLKQTVTAEIAKLEKAKLEELKKAERRCTVGTCCESQEESVWSFV